MKKINFLHIDDEELWIRTVKRILQYSKWSNRIEITAAYHYLDAVSKLERNENREFNAVLVDYRLEPDNAPDDETNGVLSAQILKDRTQCLNSEFYLLSATPLDDLPVGFTGYIDKSNERLKENIEKIFEKIYKAQEIPLLKDEINEYLKNKNSFLLHGNIDNQAKLLNDVNCYKVDLTQSDCDFEATMQKLEENRNIYSVICFEKIDKLNDLLQDRLIAQIQTLNIPVILTCENLRKCNPLIALLKLRSEDLNEKEMKTSKLYMLNW